MRPNQSTSKQLYREPDFETLQLHAGQEPDPVTNSRAVPIHQNTGYTFNSVEHAVNIAGLKEAGFIYSRVGNPTVEVFEKRMAALEGGVAAVATASGTAAIALTVTALAGSGDNIVTASRLYGGVGFFFSALGRADANFLKTYQQFKSPMKKYGINVVFVESLDPVDFEPHINDKTKAIYVEIIANSDTTLADVGALAAMAHRHGIVLIVDATFSMGGYIVKPITLGADIVLHSATKWICGHGTIIAGVIIDSGNFDWRKSDKYPSINGPASGYSNINMAEAFYPAGFATHVRADLLRDLGPCLSPMNAFLALQGLETLSLRAQRHCDNAMTVAKYLAAHSRILEVTYLGLPSHPSHQQALRILRPNAFGSVLTFRIKGGFDKVVKLMENLRLVSHLANLGDAKTLIICPSGIVQGQLNAEEKASGGVSDDMLRLSVGIESAQDIIADLEGALEAAYALPSKL
ncbi:Cys/Met metabolism PLP-dependent enzyme-domain-containing protein [Mycena metata]|uniref:Cys/Met metabolism PLP-dependent enzyme-domain-containing protein n=1 Tax=Mycena metata TaxID=1033252 RepID=A0AAD7HVY6_9AGAR|nr:Cys/Met metabolism PLP-dependent enzyme-domain-containing protein [Mycena metata]